MSIYDSSVKLAIKLIDNFKNPNSKLKYQEQVSTSDGMGGASKAWVDTFECDVAMLPISGNERLAAMKLNSEVTHKAYILFVGSAAPKASGRVIFKGDTYNIKAVINIAEANAAWKLDLKSGVVT